MPNRRKVFGDVNSHTVIPSNSQYKGQGDPLSDHESLTLDIIDSYLQRLGILNHSNGIKGVLIASVIGSGHEISDGINED